MEVPSENSCEKKDARATEEETTENKTKFSTSQKCNLALLFLVDFLSSASMSIMSPFYPKEAGDKGMSESMAGFVFSFYALVIFLSSPMFGKILPKIGVRISFIVGILVSGVTNIIFGGLWYIEDYAWYATLSFMVRGIEAFGASAYINAGFVLVSEIFPQNVGYVRGVLEISVGVGLSAGPALGGALYSIGGYTLPFYVVGVTILSITPLTLFLVPEIQSPSVSGKGCSMRGILKLPSVLQVSVTVVIISITWSFLDPTLEPNLRKFNLTPETVGLIFLMMSATYGICCPLWGWLVDKLRDYTWMMPLGLLLSSVSLFFLGPSAIFVNLEDSIALNIISLSALGVFVALALMPTYQGLADGAIEGGFPDNVYTQSMVSGIWSCVYSFGEVIGPILGGVILEYWNFRTTSTVVAILNLVAALFTASFYWRRKRVKLDCTKKKSEFNLEGTFGSSINELSVRAVQENHSQSQGTCNNNFDEYVYSVKNEKM